MGITVQHEDLTEVGTSGTKQVEAVTLGFGQCLLMTKDDFFGIVVETAGGDESAALDRLADAGDYEALGININ